MTSWNPCGARHIRPQASGLPRRSQLRRLMGRVGQPRRHPHRSLTAPFPLPLSSRMRGPIPLPVIAPHSDRGGSRIARPLPLSNHPSFRAKHSRVEESRCRSTPSLPRPSRCPRGCGDPSLCPAASSVREPPLPVPSLTTRHSSAPLRVGAVRDRPSPSPL